MRSLSCPKRDLIRLLQRIQFGQIHHLPIRGGEPVLSPPPHVIRDVKFCAESGPRPDLDHDDIALKAQVLDLFAQLDSIGNGTIRCLEVRHGLPFRMLVEEVIA
jgi:hypothetical protein